MHARAENHNAPTKPQTHIDTHAHTHKHILTVTLILYLKRVELNSLDARQNHREQEARKSKEK